MKRAVGTKHSDISGVIALILMLTAIIVSATGTWIIMDTISNAKMATSMEIIETSWPEATIDGNVALNIEETPQENQIN